MPWLFDKIPNKRWDVIGCLGFEPRCTGMHQVANQIGLELGNTHYMYIKQINPRGNGVRQERINANKVVLESLGVKEENYSTFSLIEKVGLYLRKTEELITNGGDSIILDITSFPKRYFFPILKILSKRNAVKNLVITYTKAESYCKNELSGDPSVWGHLPGFNSERFPEGKIDLAIVSVGFVPLGLTELLSGKYKDAEVRLLFPCPPGPPNYQKNWKFVEHMHRSHPTKINIEKMSRVHTLNMSEAFDHICAMTNNGSRKAIFAPYGPKPISAAIALYSIVNDESVYYTQPKYYAPDYSSGIKETYAYMIKKNGVLLY